MNSSEYLKRLTLLDLQREVPPPSAADFSLESEFPRLQSERIVELTPDEAYRNGLVEGERLGRAAASKEFEPAVEEMRQLGVSLANVRSQRLLDAERDLAAVASETARRILHGELAQSEDVVLRMARACIEEASGEGTLVLHVAPADAELVRTHVPEFEADLAEGVIRVEPDPAIARGSVVLETPTRCYDGRPDRVLEHAIRSLATEESSNAGA